MGMLDDRMLPEEGEGSTSPLTVDPSMVMPEGEPSTVEGQLAGMAGGGLDAPLPTDSGTPEEQELIKKGVKLLYDERFDSLMNMFEANGLDKFDKSVATAINTVIKELETENQGAIDPLVITKVGMELFSMLIEDVLTSESIEGMSQDHVSKALGATMDMYAKSHPHIATPEIMAEVTEGMKALAGPMAGSPPPRQEVQPTQSMQGQPMQGQPMQGQPSQGMLSGGVV